MHTKGCKPCRRQLIVYHIDAALGEGAVETTLSITEGHSSSDVSIALLQLVQVHKAMLLKRQRMESSGAAGSSRDAPRTWWQGRADCVGWVEGRLTGKVCDLGAFGGRTEVGPFQEGRGYMVRHDGGNTWGPGEVSGPHSEALLMTAMQAGLLRTESGGSGSAQSSADKEGFAYAAAMAAAAKASRIAGSKAKEELGADDDAEALAETYFDLARLEEGGGGQ